MDFRPEKDKPRKFDENAWYRLYGSWHWERALLGLIVAAVILVLKGLEILYHRIF